MAQITVQDTSKVFQIRKFLGLNESPDGDTQLKMGEASELRNWQITPNYHLRIRPGTRTKYRFSGPVQGLWSGYVGGREVMLCAADGGIWDLTGGAMRRIGDCWDDKTEFFGFGNKVYILNGHEYLFWDGDGYVDTVAGYVPLVISAAKPSGDGTTVESVNRLTGKRRIRYSPDGEAKDYLLPEQGLLAVDWVKVEGVETTAYTVDLTAGKVTFITAPKAGQNAVEIQYTMPNSLRADIESMRHWEFYNGAAETRVFLYGNGTAKAYYCGVTQNAQASAEYFPDLYEIQVGDLNSPLTGMVKHYDRLLAFKTDGAHVIEYSAVTLADGSIVPGFYQAPLNREIGNDAVGQVRLVYNFPRTVFAGALYDWKLASSSVRDERNARMISQRVQQSMEAADMEKVFTFDNDRTQEYMVFLNDEAGTVIVHRYIGDVWYKYTNFPVVSACHHKDHAYFGTSDGRVMMLDEEVRSDDGQPIDAMYVTGAMDFGADYRRKHSSVIWVSLKPTANARVEVTARSDRRSDYIDKVVSTSLFDYSSVDYGHWTYQVNSQPQMERLKLKVKKFVWYKLIIKSKSVSSTATVLSADMRVRYTGYVK